jgi:hypothetical protein
MITNNGITLLGKYLVGQIPSFASHVAIGCGPNLLGSDESFGDYSAKTSLDFEMDRFTIVSRTTNVIDGEQQIIFTAEIPSADRYGITEVGIFPAESNNTFGSVPSQTLFSFTTNEVWQKSLSSTVTDVEIETEIVNNDQDIDNGSGGTMENVKAFFLYSDNAMFRNITRLQRMEQPRFFNSSLVLRGDLTALSTGELDTSTGDYVFISQPVLPELGNANEFSDKIKIVFSVISKDFDAAAAPALVKIKIVFRTDAGVTATYAYSSSSILQNDRYENNELSLTQLTKSSETFAWKDVTSIRIYANADTSANTYIALDGIRFENLSSLDDRYSLAGYTVLKSTDTLATDDPRPIEKPEGSTTYVEFRFALDVS